MVKAADLDPMNLTPGKTRSQRGTKIKQVPKITGATGHVSQVGANRPPRTFQPDSKVS